MASAQPLQLLYHSFIQCQSQGLGKVPPPESNCSSKQLGCWYNKALGKWVPFSSNPKVRVVQSVTQINSQLTYFDWSPYGSEMNIRKLRRRYLVGGKTWKYLEAGRHGRSMLIKYMLKTNLFPENKGCKILWRFSREFFCKRKWIDAVQNQWTPINTHSINCDRR